MNPIASSGPLAILYSCEGNDSYHNYSTIQSYWSFLPSIALPILWFLFLFYKSHFKCAFLLLLYRVDPSFLFPCFTLGPLVFSATATIPTCLSCTRVVEVQPFHHVDGG